MNIELTDERASKPSASGYERIIGCPGSFQLEQQFPPETDPQAERGTRIHRAFETGDTSGLSDDELSDYNQGVKHLEMIIAQWQRDYSIEHVEELPREERLWLHHPNTMEPIASGRMDRWFRGGDRLLMVDLKSGWGTHVQPAPRNPQMRLYALLAWKELGISKIRVAIDRAKSRAGADDWTDYTEADLKYAEQLLMMHLWHAEQPDAPRYPGPHCFYCRGRSACEQAAAYSMLPGVIAQRAAPDTRKIDEQVGMLCDADLYRVWEASGIVARVIDAVDARLKTFDAQRLANLGLELPALGARNDKVEQVKACFDYLTQIQQWPEEKVWALLQMNLGELRKTVAELKQLTEKGSKGWCEEVLGQFMKFDHKAPSLRKIKIK